MHQHNPLFHNYNLLQPCSNLTNFTNWLARPEAGSDLSDSELDDSIGVEELTLIANSAATASEQMLDPGHAGGEDYQGGLIEASTENRERLVGASLESLELAQARRAAELNTTAGIAAEFAADLNVPAGISGKPNSVTHSTL